MPKKKRKQVKKYSIYNDDFLLIVLASFIILSFIIAGGLYKFSASLMNNFVPTVTPVASPSASF